MKDYSKEVADIHQEVSNGQGKLYRLLDKVILELKNAQRRNNVLELQIKAKDALMCDKDDKIAQLEEELEVYRTQVEHSYYKESKHRPNPTVGNLVQIIQQVDQMSVGDASTMNHQLNPIHEAV